jgi:hypothetical protein
MTDPFVWTVITAATLIGVVVMTVAALKGWRDWISLQRLAIQGRDTRSSGPTSAARIELADLKERVRKLEAIAAGVDL